MRTAIAGLMFVFSTCALPGAASGDVKFCDSAWENCRTELIESKWFVPQTPGSSTYLVPANASTVSATTPTLSFTVRGRITSTSTTAGRRRP